MLLEYLGDQNGATRMESAISHVLAQGICTRDLGGSAGTREFGDTVLRGISKEK
jgi:isocitrate/isopropylmalate dehydrogenase